MLRAISVDVQDFSDGAAQGSRGELAVDALSILDGMASILLISSVLALLSGPLAYRLLTRRLELAAVVDGFVFITIGALVLIEALPAAVSAGGAWTWLFLLAGLYGPTVLEQRLHNAARQTHMATLLLGALGLVLHTLADGAVLQAAEADPLLPLAVVLHRLPVGLAIWWLLAPSFGGRTAAITLAVMIVGTIAGYGLGGALVGSVDTAPMAWFQALVAGSILHVVFNKPHLGDDFALDQDQRIAPQFEGAGNLAGLAVVAVLLVLHGLDGHAADHGQSGWQTLYQLAWVSAPALLLGYLLAGALNAFAPDAPARWLSRGRATGQALRGMAIGLPMPVCSCGVLPVYRNLVVKGASGPAALAFLIATPELGIDALILSLPLLGFNMTMLRVVAAAVLAVLVGVWVGRMVTRAAPDAPADDAECCAGTSDAAAAQNRGPLRTRLADGLRSSFTELVDATAPWIIFGLVVAAVAAPLLSAPWLTGLPPSVQVLAFALVGIPTYVCAAGATPIVAVMLLAGVSPGAALAFLLAGPATNIATFGLIADLHGRRVAAAFAACTIGGAVALGLLTNLIFGGGFVSADVPALNHHPAWWQLASLAVMATVFIAAMFRRGARAFLGEGLRGGHAHAH